MTDDEVERIADELYRKYPARYLPVWKVKSGWRDGRIDPIAEVRMLARLFNIK